MHLIKKCSLWYYCYYGVNKILYTYNFQVAPRVHFKLQPQQASIPEKKKSPPSSLTNGNGKSIRPQSFTPGLKRSKSLTSADALASGMAALGLAADAGDLGNFPPEIQECIDKALEGWFLDYSVCNILFHTRMAC